MKFIKQLKGVQVRDRDGAIMTDKLDVNIHACGNCHNQHYFPAGMQPFKACNPPPEIARLLVAATKGNNQ
jgi:hypothetical protein